MTTTSSKSYMKGFIPYALAAFLVGIVGGFTTVLSTAFVKDIGIGYNNTTWTALATAISTAACAPILGKLGDVLGRKTTLLLGIAIFTLGNILTALAESLWFMLAARFIVGIGSAAIAPVVMSYIVTEFPQSAMGRGFSLYMVISSGSVVFGPTLGGMIITNYSWRVMMWLCVALCLPIFFICLVMTGKTSHQRSTLAGFDIGGAIAILFFFGLFLCIPSFGQNFGWQSPAFLTVLAGSAAALGGLITAEKKAANPILPGGFMARKAFILSVLALFLTQGLLQANMTNIIVFVNYTQPHNYIISSYAISIMYLGMSLGAVFVGPLADRLEPKNVLTCSFIITILGCASMLLFTESTSVITLILALGILGFGLGGNGSIFMKVVLSDIPAEAAGAGTGTYGLFRDLAAPFGVAVFVPMFTNRITALSAEGISEAASAVSAVHTLAFVEILCVAAGIIAVRFLPGIHKKQHS